MNVRKQERKVCEAFKRVIEPRIEKAMRERERSVWECREGIACIDREIEVRVKKYRKGFVGLLP